MAIGDIIAGIDIGTSKVCTVLGEVNNFEQIEIICCTSYKCNGLKKSKIVNEDDISLSISKTIQEAEERAGFKINSAYVTIPGKYVTIVQNSIVKEVKDKFAGITQKDLQNAMLQLKDIEVPEDKTLIDIVIDKIMLDTGKVVKDPVCSFASSFTIGAQVILSEKEYVRKLNPATLAERNLILDKNELSDNVMLLDVGAGNTDIGVFEEEKFVYTGTVPLGGDNITHDIELVLDISHEEAEKLKKQYGLALKSFIDNDNEIILNTCTDDTKPKTIKSSELIEIIEARVEEIFSLVNKEISNEGIKSKINNVILTGQGITSINKSDVAGKIVLNIPVKISTGRAVSTIKPEFRTSYALVRYIAARPFTKSVSSKIDTNSKESFIKMALSKVKEFFYS